MGSTGTADDELQIEYVDVDELTPYKNNARHHEEEDVATIKASIREFGFNDPVGVWSDETHHNEIVEGHGRVMAVKELAKEYPDDEEYKRIPVIHLDKLSDEQRRAYALAHNKTAEMSTWDEDILGKEIGRIASIDMSQFGFTEDDVDDMGDELDDKYTNNIKIPQYEITGECPDISELVDSDKTASLIEEIEQSGVSEQEKEFLIKAAGRHNVFDYGKIAEYYAHADEEMQKLMEDSALVIIDVDDAIANGYVSMTELTKEMLEDEA